MSCLLGSCTLSIALLVCSSTVGWEQLEEGWEEDSTLVAKVGSEGDGASPLTGVQVEGGFAPHRPKYRETTKQLPGLSAAWTSWLQTQRLATLKKGA